MTRQRIGPKCREDLDLVVWITFTNVEDRRGEKYRSAAFHDDASAFAPVLFRQLDRFKRLPAAPHHEVRVKEELTFDITQQMLAVRDDALNSSAHEERFVVLQPLSRLFGSRV